MRLSQANRETESLGADNAQSTPAVAYLRRSTDRQEQSIADQRTEIVRWAKENGYDVVREFIDDAISGTSAEKRPAFQRMISDAQRGAFKAVIVWNSDRFSRGDVTETEHYRYLLRKAGAVVLSVTEDYLSREGIDGDVLRTVKQFQNRQYSISLSQNTLRGQISSVLAASDPGRLTPYGYDREIVGPDGSVLYRIRFMPGGDRQVFDRERRPQATYVKGQSLKKPGKECRARLVLSEPQRVQVVRDIYRLCIDGRGFKGIADDLNRRGIMSPRGSLWNFTTIKSLLENPVYRGDIVWNRRTESKFYTVRNGRADRMKPLQRSGRVEATPRDDWIVIEDAVPAIVDRETWDRAQLMVKRRAEAKGGQGKQTSRWLLSGVLRCGECGGSFWGERKRKGRIEGRKPVVTNYYTCSGRRAYGETACPVPSHVKAGDLEAWVLDKLGGFVFADREGVDEAIDRFVALTKGNNGPEPGTKEIERELAQIEVTVNAIMSGIDPANLPMLNERLTQLRRRKEHLQAELRAAKSATQDFDEKGLRRWAQERIGGLADAMAGHRNEQVRRVLAAYVGEIVIFPAMKTGVMRVNAGLAGLVEDPQVGMSMTRSGRLRVTNDRLGRSPVDTLEGTQRPSSAREARKRDFFRCWVRYSEPNYSSRVPLRSDCSARASGPVSFDIRPIFTDTPARCSLGIGGAAARRPLH